MDDSWVKQWQAKIAAAQDDKSITIPSVTYDRIPYGEELRLEPPPGRVLKQKCRDCGCALGQLHVPTCCVESCPKCDGQRLSCGCEDVPELH